MQQTECLIIGRGLCGVFLSFQLEEAGVSHLVIDDNRHHTASRSAAGLINPVTGRRLVTTWMIDQLLPYARTTYSRLADLLGSEFIQPAEVTDFFPTAQMRLAFLRRLEEDSSYLRLPADEHAWDAYFHADLGYGTISPAYLVDVPGLLAAARKRMLEKGILWEEKFEQQELNIGARVRYRDIESRWIIFCDGIAGLDNPYFARLPFAPNKGEALILQIDGLEPSQTIFKKGVSLVPWGEGLFWAGSSYEWDFRDAGPTALFRERTEAALRAWLKLPFRTVKHLAAVRPATLERRPFVGTHPKYPAVGILNGMGTKGCSLAPFFARQLTGHLLTGSPVQADADVRRFSRVLGT
jgi:glycine/D-amino acid oxidase-like deaminating enzyme